MGIGKRVCGVATVHVEWLGSRWVDRGQLPMEREMKVLALMTDELSKDSRTELHRQARLCV